MTDSAPLELPRPWLPIVVGAYVALGILFAGVAIVQYGLLVLSGYYAEELPQYAFLRTPMFALMFDPEISGLAPVVEAREAALAVPGARFVNTSASFVREDKAFASTEGTYTEQAVYRSFPRMTVTAVAAEGGAAGSTFSSAPTQSGDKAT